MAASSESLPVTSTSATAPSSGPSSCRVLAPSPESFELAGQWLRKGKLVAFATETVYGLGANALDGNAVLRIFEAKGRPLTDPLIVHVLDAPAALALTRLTPPQQALFELLTTKFWPGPLTLVLPAAECVPKTTTAGGSSVGLRAPNHPAARALIAAAGVPIAAPSANRFGHVSPTKASHVVDDLSSQSHEILVLDGGSCDHGIESTVARIESRDDVSSPSAIGLTVLRQGAVSVSALREALHDSPLAAVPITVLHRTAKVGETLDAPGQLLVHYAPDVSAYLVSADRIRGSLPSEGEEVQVSGAPRPLSSVVLIDFGGQMAHLQPQALAYFDLSPTGDVASAAQRLFDVLRNAENVPGASCIAMFDLSKQASEHAAAVHDRMFRATQGRCAVLADNNLLLLS
eukprot:gnl/Spiro4/7088_TR3685_c1_g2_i1.p1 gnl/Spiro4/7088_TR3685_c1_g2~~gnl/Spiro4/7088_TR3685_c1_g2_i1.p1  ORF type:complete len:458 (+),score=39.95 gnl/Spiro4/7088_TR3685_c1_g2_i1:168-1376(+)